MVVLSRYENQENVIVVPPSTKPRIIRHVTVRVLGEKVKHGFIAERDIVIHRAEIWDTICRENRLDRNTALPEPSTVAAEERK